MTRATKTTKKVLESIVKEADMKNYYNDNECIAYIMLNWINEADKDAKEHEDCLKYDDMENYQRKNCFYCVNGLCITGAYGDAQKILNSFDYKYHDIVSYTHCLDLNEAIIKDVNKIVKILFR